MASVATTTMPRDREFARIYADNFGFVWRLVRRGGVDPGDVDDVVQDVFMVVYRRLPDFERRSRVTTWLAGIIRRVVWRYRRGRERARRKHDGLRVVVPTSDPLSAPFSVQRSTAVDRLDRFIAELPRAQREIFVLSELEGLRGPEIAEATGTKLNTVYARIRSSRSRFHRWCEDDMGTTPSRARQQARSAAEPSEDEQSRIWGLLVVKLGALPSVVGTSTLATNLKTFAVVFGVGGLGAIAARASFDASIKPIPPPRAVVSAAEDSSHASGSRPNATPSLPDARPADRPASSRSRPPNRVAAVPSASTRVEPRTSTAPSPPPAPKSSRTNTLAEEHQLIATARDRLTTDPRAALASLEEHAQRFDSGMLAPERLRLTVRAWCGLDRGRARQAAEASNSPQALLAGECPEAAAPTPSAPTPDQHHDEHTSDSGHR